MLSTFGLLAVPTEPSDRAFFLDRAAHHLTDIASCVADWNADQSLAGIAHDLCSESQDVGRVYLTASDTNAATDALVCLVLTRQAAQVLQAAPDRQSFDHWVAEQHQRIQELRSVQLQVPA